MVLTLLSSGFIPILCRFAHGRAFRKDGDGDAGSGGDQADAGRVRGHADASIHFGETKGHAEAGFVRGSILEAEGWVEY